MDQSQLEKLYKRIISQAEYPGGTCPTELNFVRRAAGMLSAAEERKLEDHLSECRGCRETATAVRSADQWFAQNRSGMFEGLLERIDLAGLQPGASCPASGMLQLYAAGAVPNTPAGLLLRAHTESHLAQCKTCAEIIVRAKADLGNRHLIKSADVRQHQDVETVAAVRQMLRGIMAAAIARGVPHKVRAMPGFRSQAKCSIAALVLDEEDRLLPDDNGKPTELTFALIRAEIERDGHFVIDLSTDDRNFWESNDRRFLVTAVIAHENRRLIFPPEKIYSDGRVTIAGALVSGIEIKDLPLSAVTLTVTVAGNSD